MDQVDREALQSALAELSASALEHPPTLTLSATIGLARQYGQNQRDVEIAALAAGILPIRYQRNHGTVGWQGQIRLLQATVAVVGAGGLGGWIIEGLARMGIGHLIVIDGDVFEENNLNRQAGCTESAIGRAKATVLAERVSQVNSATRVTPHVAWMTGHNGHELLAGAQILVDALDSLPARMTLQEIARKMRIPLVHGAIAGYTGQVTIVFPDDPGLASVYGPGPYPEHGIETKVGNPTATPMMVAAWQIQQVVKYLIGSEAGLLRNRLLMLDAQAGDTLLLELGR